MICFADSTFGQELQDGIFLFRQGQFEKVISAADRATADNVFVDENWIELKMKALLATGEYSRARDTAERALEKLPSSIRVRWLAAEACRYTGDLEQALTFEAEIEDALRRRSWRYRDSKNRLVSGQFLLSRRADAKRVLDQYYKPAQERNPGLIEPYLAIGELALQKNDFQLAAENFQKAVEIEPGSPRAWVGIAQAFRPSDWEKSAEAIDQVLKINPRHADTLLLLVDRQINAEAYDAAGQNLQLVLQVNPREPRAWAYRAVLAHLQNQPAEEGKCRSQALAHWEGNPEVDHLIGKKLSQKYRFQESSQYQRRSLIYDPGYIPAKMQLAHDLLRLGQELEGWKLAEEVFDQDQYNVVANNLVALRDNLSEFSTVQRNGFVVRMARDEALAYGHLVLDLLDEANQLATKYNVQLEKPIFVEIFPRQQDFAIRTFGLPGGAGFLGVCFGRLITMNSPAAQGSALTNWRSVLWHEFCHVVTLQKTRNRMPRWLSEGISVYEERQRNPAWGESMNARYREMILGDDLTPVSQLSSAFLSPPSPEHLQFAYYESSLVVEYLVGEFGMAALLQMLDDLSLGTPINDSLRRHFAPLEFIDRQFAKHARQLASQFAPKASWEKPKEPRSDSQQWQTWLAQHPDNVYGLLGLAKSLLNEQKYHQAIEAANQFNSVYPLGPGSAPAYEILASAYQKLDNESAEIKALEQLIEIDADQVAGCQRLMEIHAGRQDWANTARVARQLQGVNPLLKSAHEYLALAAEKTGDDATLITSLEVLITRNPFDLADTYYRLASAQDRQGRIQDAKKNVLLALDVAPRYRDAHRLLLKLVRQMDDKPEPPNTDQENRK